ncbi:MAG: ribosome biogenesis factor YjgA [Gammaproteobacteria bacterium]|jgi:ribosome-associated protein
MTQNHDEESGERGPSRSQLKREAEALQRLGEELITLPAAQLARVPMPEMLESAVLAARDMRKRGALKRQRQYIGRVMREIDAAPVIEALERIRGESELSKARLHRAEAWRDRLLAEGDAALGTLLAEHPGADRQHLRRLVREARAEASRDAPPRHARELFRYLMTL